MRKIILLSTLLISLVAKSQLPDTASFIISRGVTKYVEISDSGTYKAHGFTDSASIIEHLVHQIIYLNKRADTNYLTISASVSFANTVSDYFKNSKQWKTYVGYLRKQGYIIKKIK